VEPTQATDAAVTMTPPMAKATSGSQKRLAVPSGKSKAASRRAGAMNKASAVAGSMLITGVPGMSATAAPASASIEG